MRYPDARIDVALHEVLETYPHGPPPFGDGFRADSEKRRNAVLATHPLAGRDRVEALPTLLRILREEDETNSSCPAHVPP